MTTKKWTLSFEERPEDVQTSSDGKTLLIATNHIAGSKWAGSVHIANLEEETPKFIREIECKSGVNSAVFLKDKQGSSSSLAVGCDDGSVLVVKGSLGKKDSVSPPKNLGGHDDLVSSIALLGEESLVSASFDKSIKIWNYNFNIAEDRSFEGHLEAVTHVASFSSHTFASVSKDKTAKLWDKRLQNSITSSLSFSETLHSVSYQSEEILAVCGEGSLLSVFDLRNQKEALFSYSVPNTRSFRCVKFLDGKVVAGHDDSNVYVFNLEKKSAENKWKAHEASVRSLAFKSNLIISSGWDKTVSGFTI